MPEVVNLDALIEREDFIAPVDDKSSAGEGGKQSASATDLTRGESFYSTLRKPDFQRETAAWSPTMVCDFIDAFVNARSKPNAVSARAIVRNATGTKYWETFSNEGQKEIVQTAKAIYSALYSPPLQSPPRTEELPVAGHGYGSQTLPLIFDFVNIANELPVEDASKKKKQYLIPQGQTRPDETATVRAIKSTDKVVRRITGTHPSSLGLHPAVYFYSANFRHQPTAVLAAAQLIMDLEKNDGFLEFTKRRASFENFLVSHKMFINQLTVKHGSMVKGYLPIRDYYHFVLDCIRSGQSEEQIEASLSADDKYQMLVKERPTPSKKAKEFSQNAKNVKLMTDVLSKAFVCNHCGARIDKKSMHLDHKVERSRGGAADIDNGQWLHPYCDSTAKSHTPVAG